MSPLLQLRQMTLHSTAFALFFLNKIQHIKCIIDALSLESKADQSSNPLWSILQRINYPIRAQKNYKTVVRQTLFITQTFSSTATDALVSLVIKVASDLSWTDVCHFIYYII